MTQMAPLLLLAFLEGLPATPAPRPWSDRFIVDLNVSPPLTKPNGDVTVGYNGERFGVLGHAESTYFTFDEDRRSSLTERYAGNVDAWALFDVAPGVRLEPRLAGGAIYYGTLADEGNTAVARQTNQDSIFARGVGSLGVRVQAGARFALSASFGAGYQYEDYFRVAQTSSGEQATVFDAASTVRYEARLRAQLTVVPNVVSFRARGDFDSFSMHRSDLAVTFKTGEVTKNDVRVSEVAQTELFARGFVDLDVARFFGFVPAIHGGADVFVAAANGSSTSAVTPVFGVGLRREAL